jgi:hypothetical protein
LLAAQQFPDEIEPERGIYFGWHGGTRAEHVSG